MMGLYPEDGWDEDFYTTTTEMLNSRQTYHVDDIQIHRGLNLIYSKTFDDNRWGHEGAYNTSRSKGYWYLYHHQLPTLVLTEDTSSIEDFL
jgi:hypothetical protein